MSDNLKDYAFLGAIFAAIVSSITALMLAHRQQNIEHKQWLRNRKQEAYVKFWDARRDFLNVAKRESDPLKRAIRREELLKDLRPTTIRMLANADISDLAFSIYKDSKDLMRDDSLEVQPRSAIGEKRTRVEKNSEDLMRLIIEDIRTAPGPRARMRKYLRVRSRALRRVKHDVGGES